MTDEQMLALLISRMDRMEGKVDKLADAITALARVEERLANYTQDTRNLVQALSKMDERVRTLEQNKWKQAGAISVVAISMSILIPHFMSMLLG